MIFDELLEANGYFRSFYRIVPPMEVANRYYSEYAELPIMIFWYRRICIRQQGSLADSFCIVPYELSDFILVYMDV